MEAALSHCFALTYLNVDLVHVIAASSSVQTRRIVRTLRRIVVVAVRVLMGPLALDSRT